MPDGRTPAVPDIAPILAELLARVEPARRPLLIALAERMAAERYRGWAQQVDDPTQRSGLLACADREEEIARRVEALYADGAGNRQALLDAHPDLIDITRSLFAERPLGQQLAIQAKGERLGAATWRSLARDAGTGATRETLLACALLEDESASYLESLLQSGTL